MANKNMTKFLAVLGSMSALILTLVISVLLQKLGNQNLLLNWHTEWLPQLGVDFFIQVDGINFILILLTALVMPFVFLSINRDKKFYDDKLYYVLLLLMQSALFGVFVSKNLFLFYVFWELVLIPIFFIVLLYGAENRQKITFEFFIYTIFGSLFMLIALIYIGAKGGIANFNISNVYKISETLSQKDQLFVFACFFLAFAIKIPIFPFHTWQPKTYTVAPTQGTMMLSGLMLKMATFALIYWLIPMTPLAWQKVGHYVIILAVCSTIYAALMALMQKNFKTMLAYSSMSHVGLIAAGIFTFNLNGVQGALVQMLAHGINAVALFYICDIIQTRTNTDVIKQLGGIRSKDNVFSVFFIIVVFATIALPLSNAFVGEFLLLYGVFQYNYFIAAIAGLSIVFGTVYMILAYHRMMHDKTNEVTNNFKPLTTTEIVSLAGLCGLIILFGVLPNLILNISENDVVSLIEHVKIHIK